ncbi:MULTISPECIES: hypothetical protein [unclassified Actinobaculum]|uniref:hypothetical protein n=1 Tax=unclassified Actinobaculum TaxID=2609299 RepID=UPI000D529D0F|nr:MULTISPECIES: hypothetical protein [unclassified Actinobaculum]AWE41904.1 hypothetical protein DDD63_03080 [Actinobaculum sp. 313]RTE50181.1 hypothetical protein EKN07_02880 [Actinobaculum sp. 352]
MNKSTTLPSATREQLWAIWFWRLLIMAASGVALYLMYSDDFTPEGILDQTLYFTTLSTLMVFLVSAGYVLRPLFLHGTARSRIEGNVPWLRGIATCMTAFTGIIFFFLLGGEYPDLSGKLAHVACPLMMSVDWLFVGRNQGKLRIWVPLTWMAVLVPYLWAYSWDAHRDGEPMYHFLNPLEPGFFKWCAIMVVAFAALSYAVWGIGRLRGRILAK